MKVSEVKMAGNKKNTIKSLSEEIDNLKEELKDYNILKDEVKELKSQAKLDKREPDKQNWINKSEKV